MKTLAQLSLSLLLLLFGLTEATARSGRHENSASITAPTVLEWKQLDGNRINCTIASDGPFADYRKTSSAGLEWPAGSGKTAVYTAGLWVIGIHRPSDSLRTAQMDYGTEYQPGPLLETFNTTTNNDSGPIARAADPRYRLYKLTRGDTLSADYREWPGDLGAPFDDVNGNGTWDSGIDRPSLIGDQQIWCVFNDVNRQYHQGLGATPPMGVELRGRYFVFLGDDPRGDAMFIEWTIINRSDADYDSVYLGLWSDPDMGDANDDLPGSDSLLHLGYVYNGDGDDGTFRGYGSTPPAVGFMFLAGPLIPATPQDSAWNGTRWVGGMTNMAASGFVITRGHYPQIEDPPDGSPSYAPIAYSFLQGKAGRSHEYLLRPDGTRYPNFWFSGDPVTGQGDLPQNFPLGVIPPQDITVCLNAGPFTLAAGDTQFASAALLISQGADRLESVMKLKRDAAYIRAGYGLSPGEISYAYPRLEIDGKATSTLTAHLGLITYNVAGATATLRREDLSYVATLELLDDGSHGDSLAGDGIFGSSVQAIPQSFSPLRVDVEYWRQPGETMPLSPPLGAISTVLPLELSNFRVVPTAQNPDTIIHAGDIARITFDITNPNAIPADSVIVVPVQSDEIFFRDTVRLPTIPPQTTIPSPGYLDLVVPDDTPAPSQQRLRLSILELAHGDAWSEEFYYAVQPYVFQPIPLLTTHVAGRGSGAFGYRIVDARKILDHEYVISVPDEERLTLVDLTEGDTLLSAHPTPTDSLGTGIPMTDGFVLTSGTITEVRGRISGVFEVRGPGGVPVPPLAGQSLVDPGRDVFMKANSADQWAVVSAPPSPPLVEYLNSFYPGYHGSSDYEIRFLSPGSEYYVGAEWSSTVEKSPSRVPFQIWDIGETPEDPSDDIRLTPRVKDSNGNHRWDFSPDSTLSEPIFSSVQPAYVEPLPESGEPTIPMWFRIGNLVFYQGPAANPDIPAEGTVLRLVITRPPSVGDIYQFRPGAVTTVEEAERLPEAYSLLQNYPNPFNPTTTIEYTLPHAGYATLRIYNVLGEQVATLVDGDHGAGIFKASWDASGKPSGVYFYRLSAGGYAQTKKMVLTK